ncbi:MAG TPA: zinc ribbon domain-containing protein [Candidatus Limnocylindrales bacterium]|nr:zinc ribbon domain-containing protein [Candidatus Limnocylindrales bacterium]
MAFDALRSTLRRTPNTPDAPALQASAGLSTAAYGSAADQYSPVFADPVAGGGTDTQAFNCPACGRTLTRGARRCEGCGQRLILDVPMRRAAALSSGGAVAGIVVTLLLVNLFAPPAPPAAAVDTGAGSDTGLTPAVVDIPSGAMAAIRGTTAINGRLAAEAVPLAKALDGKSFDTTEVIKVLRRMAIDTRAGAGMLKAMAVWPEAAGQQAALQAFYDDLARRIDSGLAASMNSTGAYRKTAKGILTSLKDVPGLDADARALAAQGGLQLPAVTIPDELR